MAWAAAVNMSHTIQVRAAHMVIYARGARLPVWRGFLDGMKVSFAPKLQSMGMVPLPSWDS